MQHASFSKEIFDIVNNKPLKNSSIAKSRPFVERDLIRAGGRLGHSL